VMFLFGMQLLLLLLYLGCG